MEASALPASVGLARTRIGLGAPLLRLRSDEQLVSLFRAGNEDAFRAIHDRYRSRMLAYTRQMLAGSPQDPEDAVQEVFVRAYAGLRVNRRELALRAWLYRIAHNRCVDELRRPHPPMLEAVDTLIPSNHDPIAKVEQRDSLRRLIADVQRLPDQQRSALLMRELGGMPYADVSAALGVSVPAVKSLLVRARIGLAQANEARDTACAEIRENLISSHDRGVRTSGLARRHMRDCSNCRQFRSEVRGFSRRFAALTPTLGPIGIIANLLGWGSGGGASASGGAVAGGGAAAASSGAAASAGVLAGGGSHVVTFLAAAIVATGGAVEIQHTLTAPAAHPAHHHRRAAAAKATPPVKVRQPVRVAATKPMAAAQADHHARVHAAPRATVASSTPHPPPPTATPRPTVSRHAPAARHFDPTKSLPLSETMNPDHVINARSQMGSGTVGDGSSPSGSTSSSATVGSDSSSPSNPTGSDATPLDPSRAGTATGTGSPGATGTDPGGSDTGTGTSTGGSTGGGVSGDPAVPPPAGYSTGVPGTSSPPTTGASTSSTGLGK